MRILFGTWLMLTTALWLFLGLPVSEFFNEYFAELDHPVSDLMPVFYLSWLLFTCVVGFTEGVWLLSTRSGKSIWPNWEDWATSHRREKKEPT